MTVHLKDAERDSAGWQRVRLELLDRLARYRSIVENPERPEPERLGYCWRIRELKELLRMEEPEPQTPDAGE